MGVCTLSPLLDGLFSYIHVWTLVTVQLRIPSTVVRSDPAASFCVSSHSKRCVPFSANGLLYPSISALHTTSEKHSYSLKRCHSQSFMAVKATLRGADWLSMPIFMPPPDHPASNFRAYLLGILGSRYRPFPVARLERFG